MTEEQFKEAMGCAPEIAAAWHMPMERAMAAYSINTPLRIAAFLATIAHESRGLRDLEENLYYSRAERLSAVWPSRFSKPGVIANGLLPPESYACNPERLANAVYCDRMGNGPASSGDGWRYRGRGPGQHTGAAQYERCGKAIGVNLLSDPDKLKEPHWGSLATAETWAHNRCNDFADRQDMVRVTELWNGGRTGMPERLALFSSIRKILEAV
jgi:putative chitinase